MSLSKVSFGKGLRTCGIVSIRNYGGHIILGDNIFINSGKNANPVSGNGTYLVCGNSGRIDIGNKVGLSNCIIISSIGIHVGEETVIGAGTKIFDTDFHSVRADYRLNGNKNIPSKPVVIGKRCFIGANVTILKGVTVGDEAVVGAGSVVTNNIPKREIWGGCPAKLLKKL